MNRLAMVIVGVALGHITPLLAGCGGRNGDLYQCDAAKLASENLCYMVPNANNTVGASPNPVDRTVAPDGFRKVLNAQGAALSVTPKPWTQGDQLGASATSVDGDLLAYALAFEMIAPLRNAMMYAPRSVTENEDQWANLTNPFRNCGVKAEDSSDENGTIYSVDSIYKVLKDPKGQDTHHSIMRFLEEGAIDMVCLMTSLSGSFCRTSGSSDCWKTAYKSMYGEVPAVTAELLPASGQVRIPTKEIATGVDMPVLSIGTGEKGMQDAGNITSTWLQLGGRGIDTAWIYRDQLQIGKAIKDSGIDRKDIFITTKIPNCSDFAAEQIKVDLDQLDVDYVDLMLIHSPRDPAGFNKSTPEDCQKLWKILEDHHRQGLFRAIGVSRFLASDMENIMQVATVVPAVNQIEVNLLQHDDEAIHYARAHNITTMSFSPFGTNSSKISHNPLVQDIAAAHNVSSYHVSLRWIFQHGHLAAFESASMMHQQSDADIFNFELTNSEMDALDNLRSREHVNSLIYV